MSLIDTFTKPRWQHSNPEVRRTAIDELDDQAVLVELVNEDTDSGVRAHALSRVTDGEQLDLLINSLPAPLQQQAKAQRLQQLLPETSQLKSINDDALLVRIASLSEDQELIGSAINQVRSQDVRMEVASSHPLARLRLCAAQGIESIDCLQELLLQSKNRDKAVYRHCKEQVDKHQAAEREEKERQSGIQQLIEKAGLLSESVDSPEFKGRYLSIRQRWQALKEYASPEQVEAIDASLKICQQRLACINEAQEAEQQKEAQIEAAGQEFSNLLEELEEFDRTTLVPHESDEIALLNSRLNDIEERWVVALRLTRATAEQTEQCKTQLNQWRIMLQTAQRLLKKNTKLDKNRKGSAKTNRSDYLTLHRQLERTEKLIDNFPWPESHISNIPEPLKQLHEQKAIIAGQLEELQKKEKQNLERLAIAFEKFREELQTNHFDNADREYNRLRNILRQLSPGQQHHHQNELRPLVARLSEIHDWQGFAIEPKKVDLCERMRALVGSSETPDVLAGQIKSLQREWKKLGHLAPRRDQELWLEFKAAADEAYEPCKEAFAQKAVHFEQNLELRMQLVGQLVEYEEKMHWPDTVEPGEDYQQPDWKLVQKTLDTARKAFQNIKPVDRKGERKSQKKLKVVCDRIYGHIKNEYERNISTKEELISRAQSFVEMEDLNQAISQAKSIQREWKAVGMTPMRVDRKLWKKFRSACDAVFARLDEQREQVKQAMGAQLEQAEDVLKQARTLLDSDDDQRLHLKKDLGELHRSLRSIDLPRNVQQQFNRRFGDMEREAQSIVTGIRTRQEQSRWQLLTQNLRACALKSQDEKKAVKLWQQDADIPRGISTDGLESFWQQGSGEASTETQQEACIALEILGGIDSPPEDKQARMAYQMKRLVEGMGGQQIDKEQQLLEQIDSFIALRPSTDWANRFCATLDSIKSPANHEQVSGGRPQSK